MIFLLRKHTKKFYDSDAGKIGKMFLFPYVAFAPVSFGFGCFFICFFSNEHIGAVEVRLAE